MSESDANSFFGSESGFQPGGSAEPTGELSMTGSSDRDDSRAGSLSPASAARLEELAREMNAIRKSKRKRQPKPPGLHLSSLLYFPSLIPDTLTEHPHLSAPPTPPASGAPLPRPTAPPPPAADEGLTMAQRARTRRVR